MSSTARPRRLNLALQGGGAHGAFTWGVLERLLQEPGLQPAWISATSAGAVNAAAVASGLATNGARGAIETLSNVWQAVARAGVPDLLRLNPFLHGLSRAAPVANVTGIVSPYEFNPLGFDPLRRVLETYIDFERLRAASPVELLIAATDVATGRARLFQRAELTVEMVLASACLPTIHHAVEINGRAYWDGGFSANPPVVALADHSPERDTLLVLLNPVQHRQLPRNARDIEDRVNTLTFNQPLLRDIEAIVEARRSQPGWRHRGTTRWRLARQRFHLIEAGRHTAGLGVDSKVRPDMGLLTYLHGAGRTETHKWLERHRRDVGRWSTVDLAARFFAPLDEAEPPAPPDRVLLGGGRA